MPQRPELLSPAGNQEALRAAIAAGADAVYFGASAFSARADAGFDDESLREAIDLLHLHQKRAYVTVNTLVKANEMDEIGRLLEKLVLFRADAVIVQDLGVLKLIRQSFSQLCVHASTQMSVHNAQGAEFLLSQGVSRAVLARECSLKEIKRIADTGIEVEVFVHGALCVSVSGQCLFSSQIGGRSGNRGRCAQPCRLPYTYKGSQGALLSMRDLNTLDQLSALTEAGVRSFKIEGRLKRPEYVGLVTSAYRKAIDSKYNGSTADFSADQQALNQIFSRGFTPGHAFGAQDAMLVKPSRVSHEGIEIGKVLHIENRKGFYLAEVHLLLDLNHGDGLQIRGNNEQDIIYSGPAVGALQRAILRLRTPARPGDAVYRLADEKQLQSARDKSALLPEIPVDIHLSISPQRPSCLHLSSRQVNVNVEGDIASTAFKHPLNEENTRPRFSKTGGTPFVLRSFRFESDSPLFLSAASLNALRRKGLAALEKALIAAHQPSAPASGIKSKPSPFTHAGVHRSPTLYVLVRPGIDRETILGAGADRLIIAPDDFRNNKLVTQLQGCMPEDILLLPRQMSTDSLAKFFPVFQQTGCTIMVDNIGQMNLPHQKPFYTYEGIPAWNNMALKSLKDSGVCGIVLSRELSQDEITALSDDQLELILPVYGRAAIMQLNHCPERLRLGLSSNRANCSLCDRGIGILKEKLTDRKGCDYPLWPTHLPEGCLIGLYHHQTLHLSGVAPIKMSQLLDLRLLNQQGAIKVVQHYHHLQMRRPPLEIGECHAGRFLKGVL